MTKHTIDHLEVSSGPIKRVREKKLKEALNELVYHVWVKMNLMELNLMDQVAPMELKEQHLIHLIQVQERPDPCATWARCIRPYDNLVYARFSNITRIKSQQLFFFLCKVNSTRLYP
jgi:hypothetical protein